MKVIATLQSSAGLHFSSDDISPPNGVMAIHLIDFITGIYHFSGKPVIPSGVLPSALPFQLFSSGFLGEGDDTIPILQFAIFSNGYIATTASTENGDRVLDDITKKLDERMGFRFKSARVRRSYLSNIVVELNPGLENRIEVFSRIENILNTAIKRRRMPFKIKRLSFGFGDIIIPSDVTMETLEGSDFVIERRAGEPYEDNRYFSSAPIQSTRHIQLLGEVEKALL
jgi:hypothetical protein